MPFAASPALLGFLALVCGIMALVSALYATHHERQMNSRLPVHRIKIEVDGTAQEIFDLHSAATNPSEIATAIRRILTGNSR